MSETVGPALTPERVAEARFYQAAGRIFFALNESGLQEYMAGLRYWYQGYRRRRLVIEWQSGPFAYEAAEAMHELARDEAMSATLGPDNYRVLRTSPGLAHRGDADGMHPPERATVEVCGIEVELRAESPVGLDAAVLDAVDRLHAARESGLSSVVPLRPSPGR